MIITIIIISLCLNIFLFYQWGVTAIREYNRGFENGAFVYQGRVKAFADTCPTLTAEELYETIKIEKPNEKSRQN